MAKTLISEYQSNLLLIQKTINPIAEVDGIYPANFVNAKNVKYISRIDVVEHLPFRVRFSAIGLDTYDRSNPAAIGIAIIGYSNYIL
jgi:hypothetical protein